jgi:hypothetical protein
MKSVLVAGAFGAATMLAADDAVAQGLPAGSYSSWSEPQKQQAAVHLASFCQSQQQCGEYIATSKTGAVRAAYEAAACIAACFANNLPADYPDLDGIRRSALANAEQAMKLGSGYALRFAPNGKTAPPPAAAAQVPAPSKTTEPACEGGSACAGAAH